MYLLNHSVQLFETLWIVACQSPLSMGFSRQEYWSGLPLSPTGDLPDPGIKPSSPASPTLQADSLLLKPPGKPMVPCLGENKNWVLGLATRFILPVQVRCTILDAWGWCTGTTQKDGMGREEGGEVFFIKFIYL